MKKQQLAEALASRHFTYGGGGSYDYWVNRYLGERKAVLQHMLDNDTNAPTARRALGIHES